MVEELQGDVTERKVSIKKSDLWRYISFALVALVLIWGFMHFAGKSSNGSSTQTQVINVNSLIDNNDPVLGNKDAKISVVEFSDFECIYCSQAYRTGVADFEKSSYFTNGQVNLVYKQMPLDTACNSNIAQQVHPYACIAAEASLCADEQGKFWEYHNMLFDNQNNLTSTLSNSGMDAVISSLKQYATNLGLNSQQFNGCLDNHNYAVEVKKEISQSAALGGQGTPFFIIINKETGKASLISGAYPFATGTAQYTLEDSINAVSQ